jgi:Ni,Fe-hydrogenase maturation factor
VGNEDRIFKSDDGGLTWVQKYGGSGSVLLGVDFLNDQYGIASGDYGHILTTTDGGENWTLDTQVGDVLLHSPFIWNEDTAWVVGTPEYVYKSLNSGSTWNSAYNGNNQKAFYRIIFTDNYTGFISASGGVILRKEGLPEIPAIAIDPLALEFDDTYVGESSTESITITNTGLAPLEVTGINSSNSVFTVDVLGLTIDPQSSEELEISFTPNSEGLHEGTIYFSCNDPNNSSISAPVSGIGIMAYPTLAVSDNEINFDPTFVNESSTDTLMISNTGEATLNVTDITSDSPVFTVDVTNFDLEPGESQNVLVTFTPDDEMLFEGMLQVESNDPDYPITDISLSGTGVVASPFISVSASEIVFDTTLVNESSTDTLVISNLGIATLDVTGILSDNPVFTVDITNFDLEPGETQEVLVTFTPDEQMLFEGTLTIESNDPSGAIEVDLSGVGDIGIGFNDYSLNRNIQLFPNPASEIIHIKNANWDNAVIYDLLGNVKIDQIKNYENNTLDVSSLSEGLYLIRFKTKEGLITQKITIKR